MATLVVTQQIEAPVQRVFELATDLSRAAQRIRGIDKIEMLTDGPVGLGTRWRESRGKMGTEELEVTRFNPPHGYTAEASSCGCQFSAAFLFTAAGAGTNAQMTLTTRAESFFAKLMAPLSALMIGGARRAIEQDLADLKQAAEDSLASLHSADRIE